MKLFIIILLHSWSLVAISATNTEIAITRRDLNFTKLVNYDRFESETHTVTTEDGYILTLYRVKSPNCSELKDSEPIVFMHGLFLSGDDCITPGPSGSHCYEYASACHDVWVPTHGEPSTAANILRITLTKTLNSGTSVLMKWRNMTCLL